jgi:hypothetical protein
MSRSVQPDPPVPSAGKLLFRKTWLIYYPLELDVEIWVFAIRRGTIPELGGFCDGTL